MLQLSQRIRKKLKRLRAVMDTPKEPNCRWSMDFLFDRLSRGSRLKTLNITDDYSREAVSQLVGFSITGAQVARSVQADSRLA